MTEPLIHNPDEVAEMLKLDRKTVYEGLKRGEIPGRRVGRRWIIPHAALIEWLSLQPANVPEKRRR